MVFEPKKKVMWETNNPVQVKVPRSMVVVFFFLPKINTESVGLLYEYHLLIKIHEKNKSTPVMFIQ